MKHNKTKIKQQSKQRCSTDAHNRDLMPYFRILDLLGLHHRCEGTHILLRCLYILQFHVHHVWVDEGFEKRIVIKIIK